MEEREQSVRELLFEYVKYQNELDEMNEYVENNGSGDHLSSEYINGGIGYCERTITKIVNKLKEISPKEINETKKELEEDRKYVEHHYNLALEEKNEKELNITKKHLKDFETIFRLINSLIGDINFDDQSPDSGLTLN